MDVVGTARLPAPPARVFAEVADLGGYPQWLSIVRAAVPAEAHPDDSGPAWLVDLGARIGPFTRTKRLRMVRVAADAPTHARFERHERDGRPHGAWVLTAELAPAEPAGGTAEPAPGPAAEPATGPAGDPAEPAATDLRMHLHYGGGAWLPGLDVVLRQEIRRAGERLAPRVAERPTPQ